MVGTQTALQETRKQELSTGDETEKVLSNVLALAGKCAMNTLRGVPEQVKTLRIARTTIEMEREMSSKPFMLMLQSLCGHELGFGADKNYDDKTIRRAAMVALIKEARMTSFDGAEWMILAGKCYLCKPYYRRRLAEMDGITNVVVRTEAPEQNDTQTSYVPVTVELRDNSKLRRWDFRKSADKTGEVRDHRIPVRVNSGMIVDGILGKAESKALRRVYAELSGEDIPDEPEFESAPESAPIVQDIKQMIKDQPAEERFIFAQEAIDNSDTLAAVGVALKVFLADMSEDDAVKLAEHAERRREAIRQSRGDKQ